MNPRTQKQLAHIGQQIPQHLLNKLVVEDRNAEERSMVEEMAKNPKISAENRKRLQGLLDSGTLNMVNSREIDGNVTAQLNEFVGKRVEHAIKSGRIAKADRNDPFIKQQRQRMRGR